MAWRIDEYVVRGEIDNRTRGLVTGRLWLAGIEQPLVLELRGDCEPDLAGCLLRFENPRAIPLTTKPPALLQRGTAGQITAARKVRVFDIPSEEACAMLKQGGTPPEHVANALYLEWHSAFSGRVAIESADYRLEISEPAWRFSPEEIAEGARRAEEASNESADEIHDDGEWDEFRCEQFLRESDARTEKYGQLLKKYADHPESERIIAHEMGWTWLTEALDEQEKNPPSAAESQVDEDNIFDETELDEPAPDPALEGIDWVHDGEDRYVHPVQKRAKDALYAMLDELKALGLFPECDDDDLGDFVGHFMTLGAKLAGALGGIARGWYAPDAGMTIAQLKRALEILNDALAAADRVAAKPLLPGARTAHYRSELFAVREAMLALISRLREDARGGVE